MTLRDIMSRKVVSISSDDTLDTVREIMELGSVRHLPVVRRGGLVGVVSQRDLLKASLSSVMGLPAEEQRRFLEGVSIGSVMSTPAVSVGPETGVREAAQLMSDRKIGCLPVVDAGRLVGIVTETDLLRCFARGV